MRTWGELPPGAVEKLEAGVRDAMHGRTLSEIAAWRDERLVELLKVAGARRRSGGAVEGGR